MTNRRFAETKKNRNNRRRETGNPKDVSSVFVKDIGCLNSPPPNTVVYPARQNYLELISK